MNVAERAPSKIDRVLAALEGAPAPVRAATLATALALDRSAVSVRLSALAAIGMAKAQGDPERKVRGRFYTITDAGRMRVVCNAGGTLAT